MSATPGSTIEGIESILPHLFGYQAAVPEYNTLNLSDGGSLVPYAAVVTDFAHHEGQLRGNDVLSGDDGNDTIVGDNQNVLARSVAFDDAAIARAETIARDLLDISDDFSDLVHEQYRLIDDGEDDHLHHHHERDKDAPEVIDEVIEIGNDAIHGGTGNDVIIGDDNILFDAEFSIPTGFADGFEHFVEALDNAGNEITHGVVDLMHLEHDLRDVLIEVPHDDHTHTEVEHHADVILIGNDILIGDGGNDLIVGDSFEVRMLSVALSLGGIRADAWLGWDKGTLKDNDDWDDHGEDDYWRHLHHKDRAEFLDLLLSEADSIDGGAGDDIVWGDSLALLTTEIVRTDSESEALSEFKYKPKQGLEQLAQPVDAAELWLDYKGGHQHHPYFEENGYPEHERDNGDSITGDEGSDILFGQEGEDTILGGAGDDWLIGGAKKDELDGGTGDNEVNNGDSNSSKLREEVAGRLIDWEGAFDGVGLSFTPFSGTTIGKDGKHGPNILDYDYLALTRK